MRDRHDAYIKSQNDGILGDLATADAIKGCMEVLQQRQYPFGNFVLETHERTEAIKHLEIAEMYLRKRTLGKSS